MVCLLLYKIQLLNQTDGKKAVFKELLNETKIKKKADFVVE